MSVDHARMDLDDDVAGDALGMKPLHQQHPASSGGNLVGAYTIGAELGEGGFSTVHLGINKATGERVALKILKKRPGSSGSAHERLEEQQVRREIAAMSRLQHPNILRLIDVSYNVPSKALGQGDKATPSTVVVLEFAAGGELFEFLSYTGAFDESIARTYFHQLISAVNYAHNANVYHRDLKPENLLLDADFNLKLADFGFSNMLGGDGNRLMYTECGTPSYMAPEMFQNHGYDPALVDIWACGVILFIMLAGFPPFQKPNISDWWFQKLASNRHHLFWQAHARSCYFSEPTKDFLNKVLTPDPKKRISLAQLQKHEWFANGAVLPAEQLREELRRRKHTVNERKMREKQEQARQAAMRAAGAGAGLGQAAARDLPAGNPDVSGVSHPRQQPQQQRMRAAKAVANDFQKSAVSFGGDAFFNLCLLETVEAAPRKKRADFQSSPQDGADGIPDAPSVLLQQSQPQPQVPAMPAAQPQLQREPQPQVYDPFLLGGECYTKFRTRANPQLVLQRLVALLESMDCRYNRYREEFRIKAEIATLTGMVHLGAQIFRLPDQEERAGGVEYVVEVRRRSGPALAYQSLFNMVFTEMEDIIIEEAAEAAEDADDLAYGGSVAGSFGLMQLGDAPVDLDDEEQPGEPGEAGEVGEPEES